MKLRIVTLIVLLMGFVMGTRAESAGFLSSDPSSRLSTIPHDAALEASLKASGIEMVAVRHEGWDETMLSWARLKVHELTGRTAIHGQDPIYTVLSLVYQHERWYEAKFLPIEHPKVAEILKLQGKWASPKDVAENPARAELEIVATKAIERKQEADKLEQLLQAVEQAQQLGLDRPGVYGSVAKEGVSAADVESLANNPIGLREAHEKRNALRREVARDKAFREASTKLVGRMNLIFHLPEQLLLVPDPEDPKGEWLNPGEITTAVADHSGVQLASLTGGGGRINLREAATTFDSVLGAAIRSGDGSTLGGAVNGFLEDVQKSRYYPDYSFRRVTNLYIQTNPWRMAAMSFGASLALFGLFTFFNKPSMRIAGVVGLGLGLALQSAGLVTRLYLTGHMPVSNMYESIVFASWVAMALGFGFELKRRSGVIGLCTAALGFLALTGVSLMPLHDTRLHPLRAVLNSYWLNIHVTMMLCSYGTFLLAAFFASGYLVKSFLKRDALFGKTVLMPMEQMEEFAYRLVQIGWPLLTVGVMLGGVWADTAWGRFWGWDPKETWALITWIVYTVYLHTRMVMGWKGRISALACLAGFLMVLLTWLGVSYIPVFAGGLHTYASPTG